MTPAVGADHGPDDPTPDLPGAQGIAPRLVVVGQERSGLSLALLAATAGFDVTGFDARPDRVARLAHGDPVVDGVPAAALLAATGTGRYRPTSAAADCAGFDIAVITAATGDQPCAPADVEDAAEVLAPFTGRGSLVVLEATVYPGTTAQSLVPAMELISGLDAGPDFSVGYSADRVDPTPVPATVSRVVAGLDPRSVERTVAFYRALGEDPVAAAGIEMAELAKLTELALRPGNEAMLGRLARFAAGRGIDLMAVIRSALPDVG